MAAKRVIVIGGGVAGMQAAIALHKQGVSPMLIERDITLGGKLCRWDRLFPSGTRADEVTAPLVETVAETGIRTVLCGEVSEIVSDDSRVEVMLTDGSSYEAEAAIIATGFDLFDASLKEEYGYGIYPNVITSVDLEEMFRAGAVARSDGSAPRSVAILHCVGSRDRQVGCGHCSRVCCITGVKQAMELRQLYPDCKVYNFYMDMRMFGSGYEELYKEAQERYRVNFIRGRISECSGTMDSRVTVKAEDTLAGRPLRLTVDMTVLLVGKQAPASNAKFASELGITVSSDGFFKGVDCFDAATVTPRRNIFVAGTATGPKNVGESMNEAVAAAIKAAEYVKGLA